MHFIHFGMLEGTSWAKVTSNSEKIKPITLTIIELRWSESINQSKSVDLVVACDGLLFIAENCSYFSYWPL